MGRIHAGLPGRDFESELAGQCQHGLIVFQHFADQRFRSPIATVAGDFFHQDPAETLTLQIRTHDDGELGPHIVRITGRSDHAQGSRRPIVSRANGDQGHFNHLGQIGDELGKLA